MQWRLRDGTTEYELDLGRSHGPCADADTVVLDPDDAVDVLGRLARDPITLHQLRDVHIAVVGTDSGRSLSDFVVVAGILDAIHMARLTMRRIPMRVGRTDPLEGGASSSATPLQDLATLAAAPEVVPAAPVDPAVLHQIEILARAAASGTPFCEECECD
jgi:hypothetical protein